MTRILATTILDPQADGTEHRIVVSVLEPGAEFHDVYYDGRLITGVAPARLHPVITWTDDGATAEYRERASTVGEILDDAVTAVVDHLAG